MGRLRPSGEGPYLVRDQYVDPAGGLSVHVCDLLRSDGVQPGDLLSQVQQGQLLQVQSLVDCGQEGPDLNTTANHRNQESHQWIRARTVSAPRRDSRRDPVLRLTHIDGQTGLNIPEIYEQDLLDQRCGFGADVRQKYRFYGHKSFPSKQKQVGRRPFSTSTQNVLLASVSLTFLSWC